MGENLWIFSSPAAIPKDFKSSALLTYECSKSYWHPGMPQTKTASQSGGAWVMLPTPSICCALAPRWEPS